MEHTRMYLYSIYNHTPVPAIMTSLTGVSAHYLRRGLLKNTMQMKPKNLEFLEETQILGGTRNFERKNTKAATNNG